MLTIKDIAERTGIAESTVRFYRDKYPEFVVYTGQGRHRRYTPEVVDVIKFIAKCYAENMSADRVRETLGDNFSQFVEVKPEAIITPQQQLPQQEAAIHRLADVLVSVVEEQRQAQERIATALELLADRQKENQLLRDEVTHLRNETAQLRNDQQDQQNKVLIENTQLRDEITQLRNDTLQLRSDQDERDKVLMEKIRTIQAKAEEASKKRSLWGRLFG